MVSNLNEGLCCSNEQAQSSGEDHLPNRASVVAEVSGNTELPFRDLLHEFNSDQNSGTFEWTNKNERLTARIAAQPLLLN
jgi:hypothetical protein